MNSTSVKTKSDNKTVFDDSMCLLKIESGNEF